MVFQTKILHFIKPGISVIKDNLFPIPPLFNMIQKESGTDWKEMYKVFNMGRRFEFYLSDKLLAEKIIAIAAKFGVEAENCRSC